MDVIKGNIVDVVNRRIFKGEIYFNEKIIKIIEKEVDEDVYILPGLVDAHMHIESTMLIPFEFGNAAVKHGTIAVINDPHEIANVCGIQGIKFMIENSKNSALKFFFGVPSCVPATQLETSGATIDANMVKMLFEQYKEFVCLSEVMNFPAVINEESEILMKLNIAKMFKKIIDGHAPSLKGEDLKKYISAGVSTDHECSTLEEAIEKIMLGMKILIREGSAAKNLDNLMQLFDRFPDEVMLCTDDIHPDDLQNGHINILLQKVWENNYDYFNVLRAATYNPIKYYNLNVGLLQQNDYADFVVSEDKYYKNITKVYINGKMFKNNIEKISLNSYINKWGIKNCITIDDININVDNGKIFNVIECIDGELITNHLKLKYNEIFDNSKKFKEGFNKIVVINRYYDSKPVVGIVKNFNIRNGAIGSTIAHDSHNIIICGDNDYSILEVYNKIYKEKGGIAINFNNNTEIIPLPIAGLMSDDDILNVAAKYKRFNKIAREVLGTNLKSPFMTLSFLSLLVIPFIKIGDKGIFNVKDFKFIPLVE
ncbi:MAG: adenine deaminase [Bacteroidales bacterium]|nr:adenine deaminase [Bacteroidales bacterium]